MKIWFAALLLALFQPSRACELCAIYNAANALGQSSSGFFFSVAEQFVPYRTTQFQSTEVRVQNPSYLDSSLTHLVAGYNFSPSFGLNVNVPLGYFNFRRTDLRYSTAGPPVFFTEKGTEFGLSDAALIGRVTVFEKSTMTYGLILNLLGGIKFPTGDSDRIKDEVEQARIFESLLPPGTPHDPLGHSISSVHQHELALGSGSYDGVFGLTANARYRRFFFNGQFQYYLRSRGESGFTFGDELMLSGGPGAFILLTHGCTVSLQANAVYDTLARDQLLGRVSNRTGLTVTANLGVEVPLRISNNGFQSVPDYALHAGLSWRF